MFSTYKHACSTKPPWWKQLIWKNDSINFTPIPCKHTTFIPCWKKLFPRRFNVEYTSCVWRELDGQLFSERAIGRFFRKNLFLNFSNIVKHNLDARDACWTKLFRLKYRILHRIDVHLTNLQFCNVFRALSIVQII